MSLLLIRCPAPQHRSANRAFGKPRFRGAQGVGRAKGSGRAMLPD